MDAVASRCSGNKWVPLQPASDTVWVDALCVEQQPGETERVERVSERVREPKHRRRTLGLVKHWEDKPLGPHAFGPSTTGKPPPGTTHRRWPFKTTRFPARVGQSVE